MDNYEFIFKALSDPQRLAVLQLLQKGELCACHIIEALDIAQSKLSYHMKILNEANLVLARPEGKWVHYSLDSKGFELVLKFVAKLNPKNKTSIKNIQAKLSLVT